MSIWIKNSIEALALNNYDAIVDGPFGSNLKVSDQVEIGIPILQGGNITKDKFRFTEIRFISEQKAKTLYRSNAKIGDLLTVKIGSVGYSAIVDYLGDYEFAIIPANLLRSRFNPKVIDVNFIYYFLTSPKGKKLLLDLASNTAQPALSLKNFKSLIVEFPKEVLEQIEIASILSKADAAIAQTEALIAKYQRIKTGLMQDLLAKGIYEHGNIRSEETHRFKTEKGLRVPQEWEVTELGAIDHFITSGSRNWAQFYSIEGALFVRISNLNREHINLRFEDVLRVDVSGSSEGKRTSLREGDILISITADLGIIGVIPESFETAFINQHVALFRILSQDEYDPRFIGHFLSSKLGQKQFSKLNDGGAKAGLNLPTILGIKVPKLSIVEQKKIAQRLDSCDLLVVKYKRELLKLQCVKTGLMQDLLSGKVKVKIKE